MKTELDKQDFDQILVVIIGFCALILLRKRD